MVARQISVEYIDPFVQAAKDAMTMMAGVAIERVESIAPEMDRAGTDISGLSGLVGDVVGSVSLSFPHDAAVRIASSFRDERIEHLDGAARDAIGELTNLVVAGAKRGLAAQGVHCKAGLPNVVVGRGHRIYRPQNATTRGARVTSEAGTFIVEISLKKGNGSAP